MKTILVMLALLTFQSAFAVPTQEVEFENGNYYCIDTDTTGVNFYITVQGSASTRNVVLTKMENKGSYNCTDFCEEMGITELPYTLPGNPQKPGVFKVVSGELIRRIDFFRPSPESLKVYFTAMYPNTGSHVSTFCNLVE